MAVMKTYLDIFVKKFLLVETFKALTIATYYKKVSFAAFFKYRSIFKIYRFLPVAVCDLLGLEFDFD